jgi:hypothetical protein
MTTGTPPELRSWALTQLDLPPDTTDADLRGTFMQCLADEDFVPPWRWQQGFALLHQRSARTADRVLEQGQAVLDDEERLRAEISDFAAVFFDLDCDERSRRWKRLRDQCGSHPALATWLDDLTGGLLVRAAPDKEVLDERVQELAEQMRSLFVLNRSRQARRRQEFLTRIEKELLAWETAARKLQKLDPELAGLDPVLLKQVLTWRNEQFAGLNKRMTRRQRASEPAAATGNSGSRTGVMVLVLVMLGLIRAATSVTSTSSPPYSPSYQPPRQTLPKDFFERLRENPWNQPKTRRELTDEDVRKWIEQGPKLPPPGLPDTRPVPGTQRQTSRDTRPSEP